MRGSRGKVPKRIAFKRQSSIRRSRASALARRRKIEALIPRERAELTIPFYNCKKMARVSRQARDFVWGAEWEHLAMVRALMEKRPVSAIVECLNRMKADYARALNLDKPEKRKRISLVERQLKNIGKILKAYGYSGY